MKKYDSYKDSGVEWIGEIPEHWDMTRIGFQSELTVPQRDKPTDLTGEIPWLRIEDFDGKYVNQSKSGQGVSIETVNEMNLKVYPIGTVLTACSCTMGKTAITTVPLITNQTFIGITPKQDLYSDYLYYFLLASSEYLNSISSGAIQSYLSRNEFSRIKIPSIPLIEQTTIANYLDQKTSQIDDLIAKKERLIQLLEEERTAIINQAVTKGLDPTVPMKESGIEWLGEIPAHWEVKRMRYLCDITTGGKDTENREDDGQYPFYVRSQTVERISTYSFDGEAILTAGDGVGVCKVWHYVNEKFDFHQRVYMMCNFKSVIGKYLFYYLKENFGKEVMKLSAKSTVDSLRRPMFQNFLVCFGSIEEQEQIIHTIDNEEQRIQTIVVKTQQEIELLKEYKTALISEVVTGKVDVRNEKLN